MLITQLQQYQSHFAVSYDTVFECIYGMRYENAETKSKVHAKDDRENILVDKNDVIDTSLI